MKLPPIFADARFKMPAQTLPAVVFVMDRQREAEADAIIAENNHRDVKIEHFGRWWVECDNIGILSTMTGEDEHTLWVWGKRSGPQKPFVLHTTDLVADTYGRFSDWQKVAAAAYIRGALVLASYTEQSADVSVLTGERKPPVSFAREGDSLRYARITDLCTASGLIRQRGYEPPSEPSGIRLREHDVRGHWRTFSTGVRVWVRAHKRGDPSLGRVTRVIK